MNLNNFFRKRVNRLKEIKLQLKYYSLFKHFLSNRQLCISMIDGRFSHGGLSDRLKGAISLYAYCKATGHEFRLCFSSPFNMVDYLQPNTYDWRIKEDETINHSYWNVRVMIQTCEYKGERLFKLKTTKQLHYYNNQNIIDRINEQYGTKYTYGELFNELFSPVPYLQQLIDHHTSLIGQQYIASVFRFQQLLGDSQEYDFPIMDTHERNVLMQLCREAIIKLLLKYPDFKCLVTSDSTTFLNYISDIENVYVLPGEVVHMDVTQTAAYSVYMKSFLDLYMIAGAKEVYCIGTKAMYPSEFPLYAAKIRNIPFHRILI